MAVDDPELSDRPLIVRYFCSAGASLDKMIAAPAASGNEIVFMVGGRSQGYT